MICYVEWNIGHCLCLVCVLVCPYPSSRWTQRHYFLCSLAVRACLFVHILSQKHSPNNIPSTSSVSASFTACTNITLVSWMLFVSGVCSSSGASSGTCESRLCAEASLWCSEHNLWCGTGSRRIGHASLREFWRTSSCIERLWCENISCLYVQSLFTDILAACHPELLSCSWWFD